MALSIEELQLQSAEYLPAREVMSAVGGGHGHGHGDGPVVQSNGFGLVNANVNDVNVLNDINIVSLFSGDGSDNDGVDIG